MNADAILHTVDDLGQAVRLISSAANLDHCICRAVVAMRLARQTVWHRWPK